MVGFFKHCSEALSFMFRSHGQERAIKAKSARQLLACAQGRQQVALQRWRQHAVRHRAAAGATRLARAATEVTRALRQEFLGQAFRRILEEGKMVTLRNYINSLWKWKITNNEQRHFSEMMRVFRESEDLICLSTLVNKRVCGMLALGFRHISQFNRTSSIETALHALEGVARQSNFRATRKALNRWVLLIK
jgi:hypothetical protein